MNRIQKSDLDQIFKYTHVLMNTDFIKGSNIFITGATGFFGKWLLESFIYLNNELNLELNIIALSRDPRKFLNQNPNFENQKCLTWLKGDIRTFEFPKLKIDYIIHAATEADEKLNNENPLLMIETVIEGTKHILNFAKEQPIKSFLFISSGAIYGKQPYSIDHIKESDSFYIDINNHKSAYAEAKRLAELYCSTYFQKYNLPIKIARCFAFVGPYLPLNKHFAIGNFISDAIHSRNIIIKSDGSPQRSYMYPTDLIIWLLNILIKGEINSPYNVGSDECVDLKTLAQLICEFSNKNIETLVQGKKLDSTAMIDKYIPDITKAKLLGLEIRVSLNDSINKTIQFNENYK